MLVKQVRLRKDNKYQVCWVAVDLKPKRGKVLEFKDGPDKGTRWEVDKVYSTVLNSEVIHQDWKVGGL